MNLSACIIVRNEEKQIARCLNSLSGLADEIIVVHDGEPVDRTLAICRRFTDKIFIRPRAGFMEAHLPFCLSQVRGEWILRLDADEYLSAELRNNLGKLLSGGADAYELAWPIYDGRAYLTKSWPRKLSLFRKDKVSFLGLIHFLPEIKGKIAKSEDSIKHEPAYDNFSWGKAKEKWKSWARLQALNYFCDFKEVPKFNYHLSDWPKKIILRKKYPLLLAPVEFLMIFFKTLADGGWKEPVGYKIAWLNGYYRVLVNYYIFSIKRGK